MSVEQISGVAAPARTRRSGSWPLQAYFAILVLVFVAAAAAAVYFVHHQAGADARRDAGRDATFESKVASDQLGKQVALIRESVANLAANPQLPAVFDNPKGCTLTFGADGPTDLGHIDLIRKDGQVVCTSRAKADTLYAAAWFAQALTKPTLLAPVRDEATGKWMAISAAPIGDKGVVAGFLDLEALGPSLAALYGGGRKGIFTVTSSDGKVLARSLEPKRWIGTAFGPTEPAPVGVTEARGLDGVTRIVVGNDVAGVDWRVYAGLDKAAALDDARRLERRELLIILIGLGAILTAAFLVYRRVARPITQLAAAVRSTDAGGPKPVTATGPAEVRALAGDVSELLAAVQRELTEREQAEAGLRRSEESYRNLFERHPAPMWLFDPKTLRFLAVNEAATATYGYSRDEFMKMTIEDIRPEEEVDALHEVIGGLDGGLAQAGVWRHRKKDGTLMDVAIAAGGSEFRGRPALLVLAQDVTEQRRLEDQLRQAQKMEAIGGLAGGIAHDFNNILMVIRAHAATVAKRTDDESAREDLETIETAAQRATELTRQLLAFSRRQVLRPEVTDLDSVVTDTLALLQRLLGEDIEIVAELEPDLHPVVVDRSQLGQVILNLAVNARDAMPDGGTIHIRTANVDVDEAFARDHVDLEPGPHVLLQVTDSGAGMSEDTRERAFDPFFTTKTDGTGLGLATVYGIVKQTGGDIWLYSEPGVGTTFKIYLPSASSPAVARPAPAPAESFHGTETVLLVEDEDLLRPLLADSLRSFGYTVLSAASGPQAIELVDGKEIDALITDVVMPVMNGRELAERLVAGRPGLKVLFTSGYPSDTIVRQGIASATAAYIEKPYLPEDLAAKLRQVLDDQA